MCWSFIAVSYCWHSPDWTPVPVCQKAEGWPISLVMLRALLDLRLAHEGIWIDACCIDQSNKREQMHAIGSMDFIYKSARLVVILLEDVYLLKEDVDLVRMLFAKERNVMMGLYFWKDDHDDANHPTVSPMPRVFHRLMSARWFKRAWCSHEFQVGSESLFVVPSESGPIHMTIVTLINLGTMHDAAYPKHPAYEVKVAQSFSTLGRSYALGNFIQYTRSPMEQFRSIMDLDASLETDKIAIAVNLARLQLYYAGPNMLAHQCYWILAMLGLSAGDLTSLCGTDREICLGAEDNKSSWLRWNESCEDIVASLGPRNFPDRSRIISIDPEHITLELFMLESHTLHPPSTKSLTLATAFLERLPKGTFHHLRLDSSYRGKAEILACCLEFELASLVEGMRYNQDLATEKQMFADSSKLDLWPTIADLLIDAYPLEKSTISRFSEEQKRSVSQYIRFVLQDLRNQGVISSYKSGIFDALGQRCVTLNMGAGCGKALTFIGHGKIPECRFVVPTILGGTSCATMARLWLLKPREGSGTDSEWTIVEKLKLITLRPIGEDGENVVLRAGQTIWNQSHHTSRPVF